MGRAGRPAGTLPGPVFGRLGAVAAAHPLAAGAATTVLAGGGTAADAVIAAQAVIGVTMPDACGVGGDALLLVAEPGGPVVAVNGTGAAADTATASPPVPDTPGTAVTVPGQVAAWAEVSARWGALPLHQVLEPAVRTAEAGCRVDLRLARSTAAQRGRLLRGGAGDWSLLDAPAGSRPPQPRLAATLRAIGRDGAPAFYAGPLAAAICAAVRAHGGDLAPDDLAQHRTVTGAPLAIVWDGGTLYAQPPVSQGILLAMALRHLETAAAPAPTTRDPLADADAAAPAQLDHLCVEVTEAAFVHRDRVAADGEALLCEPLVVDPHRAARRGGPRAYLHTAGVAAADADGLVVSSLASVFDDYGSGVFVPEGGFVLNNRGEGFTAEPNAFRPGARPVHTLAPALLIRDGEALALATPGADGQVQTLLQVLVGHRWGGRDLAEAIDAPRWRSEGGHLLVESSHPAAAALAARGHDVTRLPDGDDRFGAVVAAGNGSQGPFALADWRRAPATAVV